MPGSMPAGSTRQCLPISDELFAKLDEIRKRTQAEDVGDVFKKALLFYEALTKERLAGKQIMVVSKDGVPEYPIFAD